MRSTLPSVVLGLGLLKISLGNLLNLTTIALSDQGQSVFECWQLSAPSVTVNQQGMVSGTFLPLGDTSNATYSIVPPGVPGNLHKAPNVQ